MKQAGEDALARRALSIARRRWISGGLAERIEVTNYSGRSQEILLDLELDVDAADIFEVRGYPRTGRGTFRETKATDHSLVFGYEGLDGMLRRSVLAFTPGHVESSGPPEPGAEGSVRIRWKLEVPAGGQEGIRWEARTDLTPLRGTGSHREKTPTKLAQAMSQPAAAEEPETVPPDPASARWASRPKPRRSTGPGTSGRPLRISP